MATKLQLVTEILPRLESEITYDVGTAMSLWWQDPRDHGGMRLTSVGHKCLQRAGLASWSYPIDPDTPARPLQLLMLKRYLLQPYHLTLGRRPDITFYSSQEATMYSLYGDIDRFVQALKTDLDSSDP